MKTLERALYNPIGGIPQHPGAEDDLGLSPPQQRIAKAAAPFAIDIPLMRSQGFFTPTDKPERLALELRAIKRRLLRRLKFQKTSTRRRRGNRPNEERQANVVLTTSTRPAEGKTFTSINLALSFALEDNIGTVLVDADVPRPKVLSHFGLPQTEGITDLIDRPGEVHLRECLRREANSPLAILPQGLFQGRATELFSRDEAGEFIKDLSARFPDRLIIIDAPPVLATPEAVILAKHVDEVVFVVEANETPEPAVATALDEVLDANERVSLVLNRCMVAESAIHYGSYEEYYYKSGREND